MTDIFDAKILCPECRKEMRQKIVNKNGFELRAVQCPECREIIIHPADLNMQDEFNNLKGKTFTVKLRMVGNSHAVSIPKEIVDFIEEQHKTMKREMDDMVRLCFEDFGRLSLRFGDEERNSEDDNLNNEEVLLGNMENKMRRMRRRPGL